MESNKIHELIEKYFEAQTTIAEENWLFAFFQKEDLPEEFLPYKIYFSSFAEIKSEKEEIEVKWDKVIVPRRISMKWFSVAATVAILLGSAWFFQRNAVENSDLGTFKDPELAFQETQRALDMISGHVNKGYQSVNYLQEYESSKQLIFNQ